MIDLSAGDKLAICGTGHRPNKLGDYFGRDLVTLAIKHLSSHNGNVISGMALGWDTALAQAALELALPLVAAVPFPDQDAAWRPGDRALYRSILHRATKVEIVSPGYVLGAYQRRNEWMVDRSYKVLALHNGTSGGTLNCIRYANRRGVPVDNLWNEWVAK